MKVGMEVKLCLPSARWECTVRALYPKGKDPPVILPEIIIIIKTVSMNAEFGMQL
jgi:hypothetical protein